jgi:anaerobic dimethyl sulfoxide reductase subunit B (iron-sulfur subunit)
MAKQLAFHVDPSACIGCKACQIACQDKNDLPAQILWRRVFHYGGGNWVSDSSIPNLHRASNIFTYSISVSCMHCQDPICVEVCPTQAMHKRDDGVVLIDDTKCVGCRYCEWACPYGAPHFNQVSGVMTKCNFCEDLLAQGENPACVDACPMRVIDFGELDELRQKYGDVDAIEPLPDSSYTHPSLVITPNKHAQASGTGTGKIQNLLQEL